MNLINAIMIAPGHDEFDHRVTRSFEEFSKRFRCASLFLESSRVSGAPIKNENLEIYRHIKLHDLMLFRKKNVDQKLMQSIKECDVIYIHDSGIYGVLLIRFIQKIFPSKNIIFDYHDLIEWEIQHHLSKIVGFNMLSRIIYWLLKVIVFEFLVRRIELSALVGVSEPQIRKFRKKLRNSSMPSISIPNTRKKCISHQRFENSLSKLSLIWIGNIGRNRSIDAAERYTTLVSESINDIEVNLIFIGKVWGDFDASIEALVLKGSYKYDSDIINLLPNEKNIGVFFGWDDKYQVGINELASPNKVYSYINIGMPFMISSNLSNVISEAGIQDCFIYYSDVDFVKKVAAIAKDYEYYCHKVLLLKNNISWDEHVREDLYNFYGELNDLLAIKN